MSRNVLLNAVNLLQKRCFDGCSGCALKRVNLETQILREDFSMLAGQHTVSKLKSLFKKPSVFIIFFLNTTDKKDNNRKKLCPISNVCMLVLSEHWKLILSDPCTVIQIIFAYEMWVVRTERCSYCMRSWLIKYDKSTK